MTAPQYAPPPSTIDLIAPAGLPPENLDPLADGILMAHQRAWIEDQSDLKLAEKGRRTGITFAEALDSTLIAASQRSAGGDNTWYIGDTKEKGLEFIGVCARFARHVAKELVQVEEFLFEDRQPDGSSRNITAYRVRFASGFQVAALSSRPSAIRGLQGRVVIDEAAFHQDVRGVIAACNALLIWGGKIRIISTHNGALNAFNELVRDIGAGKHHYSLHHITFDDAVANGLYERFCLMRGRTPSPEDKADWYQRIRGSYGTDTAGMREELDCVPRDGDGQLLPRVLIEARMVRDFPVVRWKPPQGFVDWPAQTREAEARDFCERELLPLLMKLPRGLEHFFGEDFGMRVDRSVIAPLHVDQTLTRVVPFLVELIGVPFEQQRQVLFYIVDRLPRFRSGIMDANGNGMPLAQLARQRYGAGRILELLPNDAWYRENMPKFAASFQDGTIMLPADADVLGDLRSLQVINGVPKMPRHVRTPSEHDPAEKRHGDAAMALALGYAASFAELQPPAGETIDPDPAPVRPEAMPDRPGGMLWGRGGAQAFGRVA